ncbi:MAG: hypothetical protein ACI8ZB_003774 [Desulforhopalus sp.]|jgi:hypothetical protein
MINEMKVNHATKAVVLIQPVLGLAGVSPIKSRQIYGQLRIRLWAIWV